MQVRNNSPKTLELDVKNNERRKLSILETNGNTLDFEYRHTTTTNSNQSLNNDRSGITSEHSSIGGRLQPCGLTLAGVMDK